MKTVACRVDLGQTRIAGYVLFDSATLEFNEMTPRDVERLVRQGLVNGLKFNENGSLVPDLEGWNLGNIQIKSSMGNFRSWNTEDSRGNTVYSVVRQVIFDDIGTIYEVINNRCGRKFYTEKQLSSLELMAWVGGIKVKDDDTIELCKGVLVENWSSHEALELGTQVIPQEKLKETLEAEQVAAEPEQEQTAEQDVNKIEQSMAELFNQATSNSEGTVASNATENQEQELEHEHEAASNLEGQEGLIGSDGQEVQEVASDQNQSIMTNKDGEDPGLPFEPNSTWETPDTFFSEHQEPQAGTEPEAENQESQEPQESQGLSDDMESKTDQQNHMPAAPKKSTSRSYKKKH